MSGDTLKQRELIRKWRASANKSEHHLGDSGMEIENETHMRDMRMCADELEAVLPASTGNSAGRCGEKQ